MKGGREGSALWKKLLIYFLAVVEQPAFTACLRLLNGDAGYREESGSGVKEPGEEDTVKSRVRSRNARFASAFDKRGPKPGNKNSSTCVR